MSKTLIEVLDMKIRPLGKKADLSLSINAIVLLILAITMLGLGLAFIRGQFGKVTGELGKISETLSAERKAELERSLDRITLTTTELEIKKGTKSNQFYAVRNNLDGDFTFDVSGFTCFDAIKVDEHPDEDELTKFIKFQTLAEREVAAGSSIALPLIIQVDAGATTTVYSCKLTIPFPADSDQTGTYAKKDFFITVTP